MEEGVFTAVVPPVGAPAVVLHTEGASAVALAAARGSTEARLEYTATAGRNTVVLTHTFSPAAARGRGLAAALVLAALRWAKAAGAVAVVPSCTYVSRTFLPKYAAAVVADSSALPGVLPVEELRLRRASAASERWEFLEEEAAAARRPVR